jgi:hypothetical protein
LEGENQKPIFAIPKKEIKPLVDFKFRTWVVGSVVQLVRMLPCHGRGRGFESRPVRNIDLKPALVAGLFIFTPLQSHQQTATLFRQHRVCLQVSCHNFLQSPLHNGRFLVRAVLWFVFYYRLLQVML